MHFFVLVHVYLMSYFMDYTQRQIWQYSKAQMVHKNVILNTETKFNKPHKLPDK